MFIKCQKDSTVAFPHILIESAHFFTSTTQQQQHESNQKHQIGLEDVQVQEASQESGKVLPIEKNQEFSVELDGCH